MSSPTLRRVLVAAGLSLCGGLAILALVDGFSGNFAIGLVQRIAVFGLVALLIVVPLVSIALRLANWKDPESEGDFERIVERSERLAAENLAVDPDENEFLALDPYDDAEFEELVGDALDDLPDWARKALGHVAVVISDGGAAGGAYGLYHGDGVARDDVPDRILVYRDTLRRDFGDDPDELREEVVRTVRHELAHHLGWDELGVRDLGL